MQYVKQTGRALKKRFGEYYRRMNKPKIDNFLYRHFKRKGHTPANIYIERDCLHITKSFVAYYIPCFVHDREKCPSNV